MSTAATETIIENHVNGSKTAVKAFSDKNSSGKNGFIKEKSTKEFFLDIVKEAISKKLSDDEETKEDSTNFVVSKVVEIEKEILSSELVNESSNSIENKVSSVISENNPQIIENELSTNNDVDSTKTVEDNLALIDSINVESNASVNMDLKLEVSSEIFIEENELKVPVESEIEISDVNTVSSVADAVSNFSAIDSKSSAENSEKSEPVTSLVEEKMGATVSKLLNRESDSISKETNSKDNCDDAVKSIDIVEQNINCNIKENEDYCEKQASINNIEEDILKNQTLHESNECTEEKINPVIDNNDISNENKDAPPILQKSLEISENIEKSNTSLNSENNCVSMQEDIKSCPDNDSLEKTSSNNVELNIENKSSEERNPVVVQNEIIADNSVNISQNEKSMEVISSSVDENADKTVKHSLKRPPTPNKDEDEVSKKIKLCETEEDKSESKVNKRVGSECTSLNEAKKMRSSNSNDVEQPIISKESIENSDVRENKENNKYFQADEKNDNKNEKSNEKDKTKDLKKLSKEKLKKKELKKIKDKQEKDAVPEVNGKSESSACDTDLQVKSKELEETSENENVQPPGIGKLKLKKKRKGLDEDDEYELLNNSSPTSCPLCSCDCKIKKADRKILGEKTRGLMDILSDGSDNININLVKLEELVGQTVVDWATNKCDVGIVRKRAHFLEEEHDRLIQLTVNLKKQLDDARCIMKRMIDEKLAQKSWSEGIVPLKVTRSVGMQVCTVGSAHVLIKRQEDKDKESSRLASTKSSSSNFTTNVTTPELQSKNNSSESNKQTVEITNNSVSGMNNVIIANPIAVNNNSLKETHTGVIRTDISSNVTGNNRVISPGRATSRSADGTQTMNVNIIDDDIEVIEPVANKAISAQHVATATTTIAAANNSIKNNSNNQILINGTLATFSTTGNSTTSTSTSTSTTKTLPTGIYILKTADVSTVQNSTNQVQIPLAAAAPTQQATTPASEVIDLTDNEPVSYPSSNTSNSTNGTTRSPLRLPAGQTATTNQNTVNFAMATNGSQNKVVTFPADSTTFVIHRSPNTTPNSSVRKTTIQTTPSTDLLLTAMSALPPLPRTPKYGVNIPKPPKPVLRICKNSTGIMLSWNFDEKIPTIIRKYQVFAYQEGTPIDNNKIDLWKKVGDVDALPLPMACTLTQFKEGHRYYFVVRAIDTNSRLGEFSLPGSIMLTSSSANAVNKTTATRV